MPSPPSALRILHLGKFYPPVPGGMERVVELLSEGSQELVESRVLVANTARTTSRDLCGRVPVIRAGSVAQIGSVGVCPTFPLELSRISRDVTVLHEPNPLALISDWLAGQHGPLVVWFHSEVRRSRWKYRLFYRPFLRRVLRRAARIVVTSPTFLNHATELSGFKEKCCVIPHGIDTSRLTLTPGIARKLSNIRDRYPGRRVLFVGRLVAYKGVEILLRAMASVDASALIVGDGPMRRSLQQEAERCGVSGKVTFLGQLSDDEVIAHLHACDVFVLPSITSAETFGIVQLEAMACGKPVVSTDLPTGVPWVNQHGDTGWVVPPGDVGALAEALATVLGDEPMRIRMGEAARRRVDKEFTAATMNARAAMLYRQVTVECETNVSMVHTGRGAPAKDVC